MSMILSSSVVMVEIRLAKLEKKSNQIY